MNPYVLILIVVGIIWVAGAFFGYVTGLTKPFNQQPTPPISGTKIRHEQQERARDAEEKRKQFMEQMEQKIKDHRY